MLEDNTQIIGIVIITVNKWINQILHQIQNNIIVHFYTLTCSKE